MTSNLNSLLPRTSADGSTTIVDGAADRTGIGKRPERSSSQSAPAAPRARLGRRAGVLAGAVALLVLLTGCNVPVSQWVPDRNGNGSIEQAEIDLQTSAIATAMARSIEVQRRQAQLHPFLTCVRHHESDRSSYPFTRGYAARNPRSTASGAYQFLNSTWRVVSARAGHPGYPTAASAPWWVQDAVALHTVNHGGRGHWNGTGC